MKLGKKAQESRRDFFVYYILCLVLVIAAVGTLYRFGIIGNVSSRGFLENNGITAAAVAAPKEDFNILINETSNNSFNNLS